MGEQINKDNFKFSAILSNKPAALTPASGETPPFVSPISPISKPTAILTICSAIECTQLQLFNAKDKAQGGELTCLKQWGECPGNLPGTRLPQPPRSAPDLQVISAWLWCDE